MKRVILLGDSIRMGYQNHVRYNLREKCYVWAPPDNCMHTTNMLMNFYDWVVTKQPDVLHMNAGLWDTRRVVPGQNINICAKDEYAAHVRLLLETALTFTTAKIIWATSTPCIKAPLEKHHAMTGLAGRNPDDIPAYNAVAESVARELGVEINDLYSAVVEYGPEKLLNPNDGTHYTDDGNVFLAHIVSEKIAKHV